MNWPFSPIGEVCEVVSGATPKTGNPRYWDGDIPWVTPKDLSGLQSKYLNDTSRQITEAGLQSCSTRMLPAQSVLLSSRAPIGLVAMNTRPVCTNQGFKSLVPRDGRIAADYLFWWLKTHRETLEHRGRGATFKEVSKKIVEEIAIPLPPLAEQKRIAGILDAADALRAKRREALAQLDILLQSVFVDMFGDPVTNPMGWGEQTLGDITADRKLGLVRSTKQFGWDFTIPYVRMDAVTPTGAFLPEKVQRTEADEWELRNYCLKPGDFLFNTRNSKELVGKVCVFPGPEGWLFNNNLMRIRFRYEVDPTVIAMQFHFGRVQRELTKRKSGTTNVYAVYWKSLKTLPVLVPPSDLQRRFATIVTSVERLKARQRAHLAELDTLFASLQSRAFKGEL